MHVRFCTGGRKKEHGLRQAQAMLVQALSGSVRAGGLKFANVEVIDPNLRRHQLV